MIFNRNEEREVVVLLGGGSMAVAIARRVGAGKTIFIGSRSQEKLDAQADDLRRSGFMVETMQVDALDKESVEKFAKKAFELGKIKYFIDSAGASPSQAKPEHIINLDLIATAEAIDIFANYISEGGAGLIISSQTGYMMNFTPEVEKELALTPTDKLKDIAFLKNEALANSGAAYITAKRANHLRVRTAAATTWGDKKARINSISPGVIVTPLAYDEFNAPGTTYQNMIDSSPAKRVGTSEEIARAAEFLLSDDASFITGIDLLIDGGVIAAMNSGRYDLHIR